MGVTFDDWENLNNIDKDLERARQSSLIEEFEAIN
jgi:hypothetical protein